MRIKNCTEFSNSTRIEIINNRKKQIYNIKRNSNKTNKKNSNKLKTKWNIYSIIHKIIKFSINLISQKENCKNNMK